MLKIKQAKKCKVCGKNFGSSIIIGCLLLGLVNGFFLGMFFSGYVIYHNEQEHIKAGNVVNEADYKIGLVRGCDIGCINYDLTFHNKTWDTTEDEYKLSDMYLT